MKKIGLRCIMLVFVVLFTANYSSASNISYTALNLPDAISGEDLWRYSYSVSEFIFNADYGFTVYFDEKFYAELNNPSVESDWDPIFWQPNLALPAPGAFDVLALVDAASLAEVFTIDYLWSGAGTPGSQLFEVYMLDASGETSVLEEGRTIAAAAAPIPEPSTALLVLVGLSVTVLVRKRIMSF